MNCHKCKNLINCNETKSKCAHCDKIYHIDCAKKIKTLHSIDSSYNFVICPAHKDKRISSISSSSSTKLLLNEISELKNSNSSLLSEIDYLKNSLVTINSLMLDGFSNIYNMIGNLNSNKPKPISTNNVDLIIHPTSNCISVSDNIPDTINHPSSSTFNLSSSSNVPSSKPDPPNVNLNVSHSSNYVADESNHNNSQLNNSTSVISTSNNINNNSHVQNPTFISVTSNNNTSELHRPTFITGTSNDNSLQLHSAPQRTNKKWFHINNVKPGTSCDNVIDFLKSLIKINDFSCFSLTNNNLYSSFKVGILSKDLKLFLNPSIWPSGVIIREFIFKNKQNSFPISSNLEKPPDTLTQNKLNLLHVITKT